jgi:hypothetical protein
MSSNSLISKLIKAPLPASDYLVNNKSNVKIDLASFKDKFKLDLNKLKLSQNLNFLSFQNMCSLTLSSNKQFMATLSSRIAINESQTTILNDKFGFVSICNTNGLLASLSPREGELKFLLEKYSKKSAEYGVVNPTDDRFYESLFTPGTLVNKKIGDTVFGKTKVDRALTGYRFVGSLANPLLENRPLLRKYLDKKLTKVSVSPTVSITGIVQLLNNKIMSGLDARERLGSGIPNSIIDTCFKTPSSLSKQSYNPLDNNNLNLGKNLFEFDGGIVANGPLDQTDIYNWNLAFNSYYTSKKMDISSWQNNEFVIPSENDIDNTAPRLEYVWALSQHLLYLSPDIEAKSVVKNNDSLTGTVKYALYTDNNTTRLIETCLDAEVLDNSNQKQDKKVSKGICTTLSPYVRTYENPPLYSWMELEDIIDMNKASETLKPFPDYVRNKIAKAVVYYRYVNQNSYPIGSDLTLEKIENESSMKTLAVDAPIVKDNKTNNFNYGGEFANNIFEKNFKILSESSEKNNRIDAINLVADDNSKFMDVRLPSCFFEIVGSNGKSYPDPSPLVFAMGYSTNSNVVLLCRTKVGKYPLTLDNGSDKDSKPENIMNFRNFVNFNVNFSLNPGDEYASNIKINRNHPITPKRLIFDTLYAFQSDSLRKFMKIAIDNGNRNRRMDRINTFYKPYANMITKSVLLDPNKKGIFYTDYKKYRNKRFINLLRGTLYDSSTLGKQSEGINPTAEAESVDFLTHRISKGGNNLTDPLVDSVFYLNSKSFQPWTKTIPENQKAYEMVMAAQPFTTRGDGKIWFEGDSVKREEEITGTNRIGISSLKDWRKNRDEKKVMLFRSPWNEIERSVSPITANLDATIPFIANGIKALNFAKKGKIKAYDPLPDFGSCYARCFDPYKDKDKTLETLYFYHKAAVNNGAPFGYLVDNGELPPGWETNVIGNPVSINPYNCQPDSWLKINSDIDGLGKVKSYATKYILRKEYYAMRFMALLGSYLSRLIDDQKPSISSLLTPTGEVIYENAFTLLASTFLASFYTNNNPIAFDYFRSIINGGEKLPYFQGNNFLRLCFFESKSLESLLNSIENWGGYTFRYENSATMNIASCLMNKDGINEGEAFVNDAKDPSKIGLLQYIINAELGLNVGYTDNIPDDYKQRAYRYVCSLNSEERMALVLKSQAYLNATTQVFITQITPGAKLNPEIKQYLCDLKKNKKTKGIPFLPFSDENALISHLAKIHADAGTNLLQKLNELDCEGDAFTQAEIDSSNKQPIEYEPIKQEPREDQQENLIQEMRSKDKHFVNKKEEAIIPSTDAVVMQDKTKEKDSKTNPLLIGLGLAGVSLVSYFGYQYYVKNNKKNRRKR